MKPKHLFTCLPHLAKQASFLSRTKEISLSKEKVIISLTSVPYRFHSLHFVLASLLNQTVEPVEVHLWLDEESYTKLPRKVRALERLGVCFHEVEDLRSYKKLIFALNKFPDHTIITVDDDVIYPQWWLEDLLKEHKDNSSEIVAYRTKRIQLDQKGGVRPYADFTHNKPNIPSLYHLPIGCAGVLYPAHSLSSEVQNIDYFMKHCATADDLWFKAMSLLQNTRCRKLERDFGREVNPPFTQGKRLTKVNVKQNLNDLQLRKLFQDYPLNEILNTEVYKYL